MTPHEPNPATAAEPAEGLAWTALQYSLGELPEAEIAGFEARLESDPLAQAALAQAVALAAGVKLAEAEFPAEASPAKAAPPRPALAPIAASRDENFGRRASGWVLLATAASVALWFGFGRPTQPLPNDAALQTAGIAAQRELAAAWAAGQPSEEELVIVDESLPEEEQQAELDAYPFIEEPTAPDWLIAALVEQKTSPVRGEN